MGWVQELFDQLELDAATRERIWSGTAAAWLGIGTGPRCPAPPAESGLAASPSPTAGAGARPHAPPHGRPHARTSPMSRGWLGAPSSSARWAPRCC
jgi:uncharacterized protein